MEHSKNTSLYTAPLISGLVGLLLFLMIFVLLNKTQGNFVEKLVHDRNKASVLTIEKHLINGFESLELLSNTLQRQQGGSSFVFQGIEKFIDTHPNIQSVNWSPKLLGRARDKYENDLSDPEEKHGFIAEYNEEGSRVLATDRPYYYPVELSYSNSSENSLHWIDLRSDPEFDEVLNQSKKMKKPVAVFREELGLLGRPNDFDILLVQPVFKDTNSRRLKGGSSLAFLGFVSVSMDLDDLIGNVFGDQSEFSRIKIEYMLNNGSLKGIYEYKGERYFGDQQESSVDLEVAGRPWKILVSSRGGIYQTAIKWIPYFVLFAGVALTALVVVSLIHYINRRRDIEIIVSERTKEISSAKIFHDLILDSMSDYLYVKDDKFRFVEANKAFTKLFPDNEKSNILGSTAAEQFSAEEYEDFLRQDRIALELGYSDSSLSICYPDGVSRVLHTKKTRFEDADGKAFVLCISRDISDLKKQEIEREDQRCAMENTVSGVSRIDRDGLFEYANEAFLAMCGNVNKPLLGEHWLSCIHAEDVQVLEQACIGLLPEKSVSLELRTDNGAGLIRYVKITLVKRWFGGEDQSGHHCFMEDITVRKQAEERLRDSEEQYEISVRGSSVGLWDWNVETGTLFLSSRLKQIIGAEDQVIISNFEEFVALLHPEDKLQVHRALLSHFKEKTPFDMELRVVQGPADSSWIHVKGQALWNEDGLATRMAGSLNDITESKKTQQELVRSNVELERFAYVASHDLQEPLRMVANFTALLECEYGEKLGGEGREYLEIAHNSAKRMQALVTDLLEYARVGTQEDKLEFIELAKILETVKKNLCASIESSKALITCDARCGLYGNPVRVMMLLQNIVSNGLKYQKEGQQPKLHIVAEIVDGQFHVSVQDNGIGMRSEYCEKIFEPFKRLHANNEYAGTGMGLAICRKIVDGFDGEIWAESEYGVGSVMTFTMPVSSEYEEIIGLSEKRA